MRDVLADYDSLIAGGEQVGRAVVMSVWGSAPRREGACLLATVSGRMAGSVSGGCVETATAEEIRAAIERGTPKRVSFGVSDQAAWEVGLACGGTINVWVEPLVPAAVVDAAHGPGGSVVATILDGPAVGSALVVSDDGTPARWQGPRPASLGALEPAIADAALNALRHETSRIVDLQNSAGDPVSVFLEVFPRRPTLLIFGGVHIAAELVPLAKRLGYRTVVADGREAFLTRERFPDADELVLGWPEQVFRSAGIDRATYVCLLSHDPKFDEPALRIALRSPAAYVGAIGSRKTQEARRKRLLEGGFSEEEVARLHGPIGLDLGGRSPAETALAIVAEMTAVRYGGQTARRTGGK